MNEKDAALQAELLEAFTEAEEWQRELVENPQIAAMNEKLQEAAGDYEPNGTIESLISAAYLYVDAVTKAAILYGMRIGDVLRQ